MQIVVILEERGELSTIPFRLWDAVDMIANSAAPGAVVVLPRFGIVHTPGTDIVDIQHLKEETYNPDNTLKYIRKFNLSGLAPAKKTELLSTGHTTMALAAILNSQRTRA